MNNYDANNAEHRMVLALDFVTRAGATEPAFDRAAHQYQVSREELVEQYDREYLLWAADRGLDN
jgi:hypothetical protein